MRRRTFVKGVTAVPAGWIALAGNARAAHEQLAQLRDELRGLREESALWSRVRQEFLLNPGLVHLNTGTIGATPRPVIDAVAGWMYQLEGDPASNVFGPLGARMEDVRAKAAEFLGCRLDEVVLTDNTTTGMNAVAQGIGRLLRKGDEVLTTNHEHPGGSVCWEYLAKHQGVKIVRIPMPAPIKDKGQILQLVQDHLTPRTRVCSFSHIETITGLKLPLADIAALTRPRDILLVCDGAQAPGMLKIDLKALWVDAYASSSHKWMLAPKGSGLLYIRKEVQDRIQPLLLSTGYNAYTAACGTRNVPQVLGHGLTMDFHNAIGRDRVEARCLSLCSHLRKRLCEISSLRLLTPTHQELSGGIVSFTLTKGSNQQVCERLHKEHDIVVKVVPKPEYNALRFSTHIYNREEDLDRTADVIGAMLLKS
ncbi:MAG: aminotransferase class V-fold PLP-dependent enzyme [Isosphaerales bacterium]